MANKLKRRQIENCIRYAAIELRRRGVLASKVYCSYNTLRLLGEPIDFEGMRVEPSEHMPDDKVSVQ